MLALISRNRARVTGCAGGSTQLKPFITTAEKPKQVSPRMMAAVGKAVIRISGMHS